MLGDIPTLIIFSGHLLLLSHVALHVGFPEFDGCRKGETLRENDKKIVRLVCRGKAIKTRFVHYCITKNHICFVVESR